MCLQLKSCKRYIRYYFCPALFFVSIPLFDCKPSAPELEKLSSTDIYYFDSKPLYQNLSFVQELNARAREANYGEKVNRSPKPDNNLLNLKFSVPKPLEWDVLETTQPDLQDQVKKYPKYISLLYQPGETLAIFVQKQPLKQKLRYDEFENVIPPEYKWHNFVLLRLNNNSSGSYGYSLPLPSLEDHFVTKHFKGATSGKPIQKKVLQEGLLSQLQREFSNFGTGAKIDRNSFTYRMKSKYADKNARGYKIDWGIGYQNGRIGFTVEASVNFSVATKMRADNPIVGYENKKVAEKLKAKHLQTKSQYTPIKSFKVKLLLAVATHPKWAVVILMVADEKSWDGGLKKVFYGMIDRMSFE